MSSATLSAKDLKRLVAATKSFVSTSDTKFIHQYNHQYIKLDFSKEGSRVTAVALDGHRLSVETAVCVAVDEDFTAYIKPNIMIPKVNGQSAIVEVRDDVCYIDVDGCISGYKQPHGVSLDYKKLLADMTKDPPTYRIGFNGDLLISALQAARVSCGNSFKTPVVLEFRGNREPVLLRTNERDVKVVLPIILRDEVSE